MVDIFDIKYKVQYQDIHTNYTSQMKTPILIIGIILILSKCDLTIEQYQQLEKETPELVFEPLQSQNLKQLTPNIQKLIFTTPWNTAGGDLVIKYAKKFDYVSPCWYDLTFSSDHIIIQNDKLYNQTFVKLLRQANPKIKILPRFYIASNQQALLHSIGSFEVKFKQAISLIMTIIQNQKFDGLVWDSPYNTMVMGQKYLSIRNLIVQFVNSLKMNLKSEKILFFNMANPMGVNLATEMYAILNVDCILIQNYDNDRYQEMIQSSIHWAKNTKFNYKPKIMLMLPFFARRAGQGIDTKQIKKLYEAKQRMGSRIQNGICVFYQYTKRIQSFVPCYAYFKKAFKQIGSQGFRMGFWEAGNGLENYYKFL